MVVFQSRTSQLASLDSIRLPLFYFLFFLLISVISLSGGSDETKSSQTAPGWTIAHKSAPGHTLHGRWRFYRPSRILQAFSACRPGRNHRRFWFVVKKMSKLRIIPSVLAEKPPRPPRVDARNYWPKKPLCRLQGKVRHKSRVPEKQDQEKVAKKLSFSLFY